MEREEREFGAGRVRLVIALFGIAYLALSITWAFSNPAPSGTDEAAHYVKALATARGQLVGPHEPYHLVDTMRGLYPGMVSSWDQSTMAFRIPARQAPASSLQCTDGQEPGAATCVAGTRCQRWNAPCVGSPPTTGDVVVVTPVGDYIPTFYLVPGLLAQLGSDDVSGLRLARVGSIVTALALMTLAALLLVSVRGTAFSIIGLLVAVTPSVVFLNSVLNPNGSEIAISLCFAAAMLRVWRDEGAPPKWVWLVVGGSGAVLGFSRFYGPIWILGTVLAVVLLMGLRRALEAIRRAGWPAMVAVGLVIAGVLADFAWWGVVGTPRSRVSLLTFPRFLLPYAKDLPMLFAQEIGYFGWMDIPLGIAGWLGWTGMVGTVFLLALLVASARQRLVLLVLVGGDVIATVVLISIMQVAWDFPVPGVYGRYFLPATVVVVLLAGEILHRNRDRLGEVTPRNLLIYLALAAGLVHVTAIWVAAHRYAVGFGGRMLFMLHPQWSPAFGWWLWLGLAAMGSLLLVAMALVASRPPTSLRRTRAVLGTAGRGAAGLTDSPVQVGGRLAR